MVNAFPHCNRSCARSNSTFMRPFTFCALSYMLISEVSVKTDISRPERNCKGVISVRYIALCVNVHTFLFHPRKHSLCACYITRNRASLHQLSASSEIHLLDVGAVNKLSGTSPSRATDFEQNVVGNHIRLCEVPFGSELIVSDKNLQSRVADVLSTAGCHRCMRGTAASHCPKQCIARLRRGHNSSHSHVFEHPPRLLHGFPTVRTAIRAHR